MCPGSPAVRASGMGRVPADRDDAAPRQDVAATYGTPFGTAADRGIRRSPNGAGGLGIVARREADNPQHADAKQHRRLAWRVRPGRY